MPVDALFPLLERVSRSFYLSIRVLPAPLRPGMGVAYLVCRAADTIADTDAVSPEARLALLRSFSALMERFPFPSPDGAAFAASVREHLSPTSGDDALLLERFGEVLSAIERRSTTERAAIQRVAAAVAEGMIIDLESFGTPTGGVRALKSDAELERYLERIGGAPGRFWTDLSMAHGYRPAGDEDAWRREGIRFGTGLQLVNILRDVGEDYRRGRCYLPTTLLAEHHLSVQNIGAPESREAFLTLYHRLIDDALARLRSGVDYLARLPATRWRLKAAVWWPLALGAETLALLREESDPVGAAVKRKVTRSVVRSTLIDSAWRLWSTRLIERRWRDLRAAASSEAGFGRGRRAGALES